MQDTGLPIADAERDELYPECRNLGCERKHGCRNEHRVVVAQHE